MRSCMLYCREMNRADAVLVTPTSALTGRPVYPGERLMPNLTPRLKAASIPITAVLE